MRIAALYLNQEYEEALASFEKAIKINPNSARAWSFKGAVLSQINQNKEACAAFQEALRLEPNSPQVESYIKLLCR